MTYRMVNLLALASLLPCVGVLALWVRSDAYGHALLVPLWGRSALAVQTYPGRFGAEYRRDFDVYGEGAGFVVDAWPESARDGEIAEFWGGVPRPGRLIEYDPTAGRLRVVSPCWPAAVASAAPAAWLAFVSHRRRRRRRRSGVRCAARGYDVRAMAAAPPGAARRGGGHGGGATDTLH